jgi:hypothetical protein
VIRSLRSEIRRIWGGIWAKTAKRGQKSVNNRKKCRFGGRKSEISSGKQEKYENRGVSGKNRETRKKVEKGGSS